MVVGHLAVGFAAKRAVPSVRLPWLIAAGIALDLLFPIFVLIGIEHFRIVPGANKFNPLMLDFYPWSHSLVMACVWGVALAVLARARGIAVKGAAVIAALVVSHWVLDFASHTPDMPLWPGDSPKFGLGLWNSLPAIFLVEGALWITALIIYLRTAPLASRGARIAFWSFIGLMTFLWIAGPWSPAPPSPQAVALSGLIQWLAIPWMAAVERR
jgi:membrane-bound metal-dependent hydrolase YbcI (DUF457 family)